MNSRRDITERKQAEEARAQLAAIVETTGDAVVSCVPDGTVLSWNAGAERILGYPAAEIVGRNISIIAPRDRRHEMQHHEWLLQHGKSVPPFETIRVAKDGRPVDVQMTVSAIPDAANSVTRIAYIFRDVTERKRAEHEGRRRAALTELLERLARAANEATTPEAALRACLERICAYGDWTLGRVAILRRGCEAPAIDSSLWHDHDLARFAEFIRVSENYDYARLTGKFISAVLRDKRPMWIEDFREANATGRLMVAIKAGLRSGFAFPVIVQDKIAAFLEFFAEEPREPDRLLLEAIEGIGSQLARMIERQHALDEARANGQKLDGILGALHEVVWSMDARSGRLLYLNAAARRLTRRPVVDFLADRRLWRRMIHPDDRAAVRRSVRELLGKDVLTHEFRIVLPDGEVRVVENRARVVRDAHGAPQRIDGTIDDITERKQAEEERGRLAAIVESSNDAIISRDLNRRITTWNAAAERLFGYTAAEVMGQSISLIIPPDQEAEAARNRARLRAGQTIPAYDTVRLAKDGRRIYVSTTQSPIRDASGKIIGVSLMFRDISERKKAEEERGQLAAIVESSQDAIIGRTLDGTITSWNAGAEQLYGYTAEEAIGQRALLLTPPALHDETEQNRELLKQGKPVALFETVRLTKDGRRIDVQMSLSPIRDGSGNVIGTSSTSRDISERKRYEREAGRRAALTTLLEALARAANEAVTPEDALQACVERMCEHGRWTIGHVMHLLRRGDTWTVARAQWYFAQPGRFDEFARASDAAVFGGHAGGFVTPAILERKPFWVPDLDALADFPRIALARSLGLRSGFVFPVVAGGEIAACFEFFADEVREPDGALLEALPGVASQLARLIERTESERRRAMEHAVSRVLANSEGLNDALPKLIRTMCEAMDWAYGARWAWSEAEQRLCRAEFWSAFEPEFEPTDRDYWLSLGSGGPGGLLRRAWQAKETTWLANIDEDASFRRKPSCAKFGLRSAYSFPILAGNTVIGVMEFFGRQMRQPDQMLLQITDSIGRQIGQFIQRKEAEEALGMSEERFRATFEQAGVGMGLRGIDPRNPRWLRVNQKLCEIFGYTREELLQLTTVDLTPPEDRDTAIDYNEQLLRGEITSYSREKRYVRKDGKIIWTNISLAAVHGPDGRPTHVISVIQDITERKQAEERIGFLAQYDVVTGLPNRRLFTDRLGLAMARDRRLGKLTALLLLDLDRFRQINDTFGQSAGDEALQMVTARLRERLREVDTLARLGGDEFAVILESVTHSSQALRVGEKIMEAMAEPITLKGEEVFITASIGVAISLFSADAGSVEKLIENAELAMFQAKQEGRNTIQLHAPDPSSPRRTGLSMESRLRRALERDELLLHFQPKVDVRTGAITGAEALVRWRNSDLGMVSPANFIPVAEETGLIVPIGEWVLHSACAQAGAWHRQGHAISVAVNLSARQFRQSNLCETVELALADSGLKAGRLELEITESMIMHRPEQTIATLKRLHDIGLILSVDDFGTGYSSLSYLKRFPVHKLKIDQSFVRELHKNADDSAIVRAVIALATSLNLKTVAEGVETEQQLIFLAGLQCDEYQGYYFSKPLPAAEFQKLLQERSTPAHAAAAQFHCTAKA